MVVTLIPYNANNGNKANYSDENASLINAEYKVSDGKITNQAAIASTIGRIAKCKHVVPVKKSFWNENFVF